MADQSIAVHLRAIVGPYQAAMTRAAATTRGFGQAAGQVAPAVGRVNSSVGSLNPMLIGAGGLVVGIQQTVSAAIEWESAFAGVRKTVNGTEAELAGLEAGLRALSTEIPTSAVELASIAEAAGQLGVSTGGILEFTETMAMLGETTNLSATDAATQLARLSNIMGTSEDDIDRLGSVIVDLGNNSATTEREIVELAMRIAGAGVQVGLSEGEVLAFAAALSSVGISAEAGGTSISRVFLQMQQAARQGGAELEVFAEIAGQSTTEFARAFEDDAAGATVAFIEGLGDIQDAGGDVVGALDLLELGEIRVRDTLLRSSSASDVLNDSLGRQATAWADNTALADEAAQRFSTTESRMQIVANKATDVAVSLGDTLGPAVDLTIGKVSELIDTLSDAIDWFNEFEVTVAGANFNLSEDLGQAQQNAIDRLDLTSVMLPVDAVGSGLLGAFGVDTTGIPSPTDFLRDPSGAFDQFREGGEILGDVEKQTSNLTDRLLAGVDAARNWAGGMIDAATNALGLGDSQGILADKIAAANRQIGRQHDLIRESSDPVFALRQATAEAAEAQSEYNAAVDKFGQDSPEAADAAALLFDRVLAVAGATVEADGKFGDVVDTLRRMEDQGLLTAAEVETLLGVLVDTRDESEKFAGEYNVSWNVDTSDLDQALRKLREIAQLEAALATDGVTGVTPFGFGGVNASARAAGGPFGSGELMLVGEEGPELVRFGQSGTVIPAPQTAQAMSGTTIGTQITMPAGAVQVVSPTPEQTGFETAWQLRRLAANWT